MKLSFKTLAIGVVALGIAMGGAFGAGAAYGRGDTRTVQAGLTQQQIQQLYGAPTNPSALSGAGAGGQAGGQGAGTGAGSGMGGGGAAAGQGRSTTGRVTAVEGNTVTIETARGSQKVTLASGAAVTKMSGGVASDLAEGTTIFASGTSTADGGFEATAVTQVPSDLGALLTTLSAR